MRITCFRTIVRFVENLVSSEGMTQVSSCSARRYYAITTSAIIMPDDVAEEKVKALRALGAHVERVRPASIVDKKQVISDQFFLFDAYSIIV